MITKRQLGLSKKWNKNINNNFYFQNSRNQLYSPCASCFRNNINDDTTTLIVYLCVVVSIVSIIVVLCLQIER